MRGLVDHDEPLFRCSENDGVVAAPAMRISVLKVRDGREERLVAEHSTMMGLAVEDIFTFVFGQAFEGTRPRLSVVHRLPARILCLTKSSAPWPGAVYTCRYPDRLM